MTEKTEEILREMKDSDKNDWGNIWGKWGIVAEMSEEIPFLIRKYAKIFIRLFCMITSFVSGRIVSKF